MVHKRKRNRDFSQTALDIVRQTTGTATDGAGKQTTLASFRHKAKTGHRQRRGK